MNKTKNSSLASLPDEAFTRDGIRFSPSSDRWTIDALVSRITFDFARFTRLDADVVHRLKRTLCWQLQHQSPSYASNLFNAFRLFYESIPGKRGREIKEFLLSDVLIFQSRLSKGTVWQLGSLRILLAKANRQGHGMISPEGFDYLKNSKIAGNVKGTSIRTRDPLTGAFNDVELQDIQSKLNRSFAEGTTSLYSFGMAWLLLAYGMRSVQIAAMKESDLIVAEVEGEESYVLRIPRAKQRGASPRKEFKLRHCGKQLGQLLKEIIAANAKYREELNLEKGDWPPFLSPVEGAIPGFSHHFSSEKIGTLVERTVGRLTNLKSNPRRFRNTLAQRAVDDGHDIFTVAEILDHSDTQNARVYFEAGPSMVPRLDRALALELAPIAQAFAGVGLGSSADPAQRPPKRLYDRALENNVEDALGECGQMSFCGLSVPYACYTCRHFRAWDDGPHEQFLSALIEDRERMKTEKYSPRIYMIRDRLILAVAEVVQMCSENSTEEGNGE